VNVYVFLNKCAANGVRNSPDMAEVVYQEEQGFILCVVAGY